MLHSLRRASLKKSLREWSVVRESLIEREKRLFLGMRKIDLQRERESAHISRSFQKSRKWRPYSRRDHTTVRTLFSRLHALQEGCTLFFVQGRTTHISTQWFQYRSTDSGVVQHIFRGRVFRTTFNVVSTTRVKKATIPKARFSRYCLYRFDLTCSIIYVSCILRQWL